MTREDVIKWLEYLRDDARSKADGLIPTNIEIACSIAIEALKDQEPRVMTLEEIKNYLDDPDGDKKPLWLEWHSIPALSGWVLASQVSDLMKRYMDSYNNTWRPWTSRPTDEQRVAVNWDA